MVAVNFMWPAISAATNSIDNTSAIAATGEKLAFCGQFHHADAASGKSIQRVGFRFGAVTKAGGSGLTVSLQNMDATTTTAPMRPDETQDETVAIANGNAAFAANTYIRTDAFSANRAISNGDMIAVVIEYDGGGRLGADSVTVSGLRMILANRTAGIVRKSAGVWARQANASASIALECTDGSFGFLTGQTWPASAITQRTYQGTNTPDERANSFVSPFTATIDAIFPMFLPNALTADFDLVIYENGTAIHTQSFDASYDVLAGTLTSAFVLSSRVVLTAGATYYVAFRPGASSSCSIWECVMNSAGLVAATGWGSGAGIISRTDSGSWSSVTETSIFPMQLRIVDIAASGSSGIPIARGMHGGMR
jgi:hypothetical protein